MTAMLERQTPANYIHFALQNPRGIAPHFYKDQLKALLKDPCDNAGETLLAFRQAVDLNTGLSSTFYSAVCDVFKKLRDGVEHPQRWNAKMETLKSMVESDPTLLKYTRETLLAGSIPVLTSSHSTDADLQVASDILSVSGTSPLLADVIKPEWVKTIVMWHLKHSHHKFEVVAPFFKELRDAQSFVPVIAALEEKYKTHVDSEQLPYDDRKNLVLKFKESHDGIDAFIVDLSNPNRANHPHEITLEEASAKYQDSLTKILERSTDLDDPKWVAPIAAEVSCRLG